MIGSIMLIMIAAFLTKSLLFHTYLQPACQGSPPNNTKLTEHLVRGARGTCGRGARAIRLCELRAARRRPRFYRSRERRRCN